MATAPKRRKKKMVEPIEPSPEEFFTEAAAETDFVEEGLTSTALPKTDQETETTALTTFEVVKPMPAEIITNPVASDQLGYLLSRVNYPIKVDLVDGSSTMVSAKAKVGVVRRNEVKEIPKGIVFVPKR